MKKAITVVLSTAMLWGMCIHQARGEEKAPALHPAAVEYEGVLTASDERADTITLDTESKKVILAFTESTLVKAHSKNSPSLCYESRGGVLFSIALARITVGDWVHVSCEPVKTESRIVCRKIEVEASAPHSQNHTRLVP